MVKVIRSKRNRTGFQNFKLFVFLGVMTLVVGLTFYLTTQRQDIRQNASFTSTQTFDPGFVSFIILAANQNELPKYQQLGGTGKSVSYRTVNFDPQQETNLFEQNGWSYYLTAASSDFIAHQNSQFLYNYNTSQLDSIAQKPGFRGFYFHEMMTYRALVSGWDWNQARDTVDWGWVKQVVAIAKQYNKKVIWSEPTYAWKTIYESQPVMDIFAQWGSTMVPMYATNFTQTEINSSKEFATKVAQKYTLALGQSHQGWYWQNAAGGTEPTREGSYDLALDGWNSGARYFQFEGNVGDFLWDSAYMLGVRDFSNFISSSNISPTPIPPTATPIPTATPTRSPTTAPQSTGLLRVETIPPTPAYIRVFTETGEIVLYKQWSINWEPLPPKRYFVQFVYQTPDNLKKPKTMIFNIYAGKTTEIIGDFNTGKTTVTYK